MRLAWLRYRPHRLLAYQAPAVRASRATTHDMMALGSGKRGQRVDRERHWDASWPAPICALIAVVATTAVWIGCDSDDDSGAGVDKYFLRDVAAMQATGLPAYWLGTEFPAGGLAFRGPYGAEFGGEVDGGIGMTYLAPLGRGNTGLELIVRSRDAWAAAKEGVKNPGLPGVTRRMVTVGDRDAELISVPLGTRPVNTLWLVLDLGDAVVLGQALAGGAVYPGGPDYNPFINNPGLLIQVMEGLRPYPE